MSRAAPHIDPLSDTEFDEPAWGHDLDLSSERPKGATMRGSALATFMAAAVVTTALGLGGSFAITSAMQPEPVRPRFAFTSAAWSVTPTEVEGVNGLSEPLPSVTSNLAGHTSAAATHLVRSVADALALRGAAAATTAGQALRQRRTEPLERSRPAVASKPTAPAIVKTAAKTPPAAKPEPAPPPEPSEDALLAGLPGIDALEATAQRLAEAEAAEAPAPAPAPAAVETPVDPVAPVAPVATEPTEVADPQPAIGPS